MQANPVHGCFVRQKKSTSKEINRSTQPLWRSGSRLKAIEYDHEHGDQQVPLQFDVLRDGTYLYWAVTLAYLIPVKNDDAAFEKRCKDLFGNGENVIKGLDRVRTLIQNFNPLSKSVPTDGNLERLVRNTFRNRVLGFKKSNPDRFEYISANERYSLNMRKPEAFATVSEMQAISLILNCKLHVYEQCFPKSSNCKLHVYEQCFPKSSDNLEMVTLVLFRVKHSYDNVQNANKYCYKLEKSLIMEYRERLICNSIKWLQKRVVEKLENYRQERDSRYYNGSSYNSMVSFEKNEKSLDGKNLDDIANIIGAKFEGINNPEILELNELGKLINEYQVKWKVANQLTSKNYVRNIYDLFQNPKHVAGILEALTNISENIQLLKGAFRLLKHALDDLYNSKSYDRVIEILNVKEVGSVKCDLLSNDSSDFDVLQILRIMALTKNRKDAVKILNDIKDRMKISNISKNPTDDTDKFSFSLLISSDIAYSKHLMHKCEESKEDYKELHDKILKHVGIIGDASILSYESYNKVALSEKYLGILSANQEYLNILHIKGDIAHELICTARQKRDGLLSNKFELNEVLQDCEDALTVYEEVFEIKRFDAENLDIKKTMLDIAYVNNYLACLKSLDVKNNDRLEEVLRHHSKALEMCFLILTIEENDYLVNSNNVQHILKALEYISFTYYKLSTLISSSDSTYLEKSLYILERIYAILKDYLGENDKYTKHIGCKIYSVKHKLCPEFLEN